MKPFTRTKTRTVALCLCLLAACAPATQLADPTGGFAGPTDEGAVLGVWAYEVTGSCFLLRGDLFITQNRSGLSGRLTEKPFAANEDPDTMQRIRDQQRCDGRRAIPATIIMDEIHFDGEMLVFAGASTGELGNPYRVNGRVKVKTDTMSGSLTIDGSSGNIIRNEAARMKATRADRGRRQPYEADVG